MREREKVRERKREKYKHRNRHRQKERGTQEDRDREMVWFGVFLECLISLYKLFDGKGSYIKVLNVLIT